jgi:hypothetical protein
MNSTNKTSLKSVFTGSDNQLDKIHDLVTKVNRLLIHGSHFMKFHALRNPTTMFSKAKCAAILALLNNHESKQAGYDEFLTSLTAYVALTGNRAAKIPNFQQLSHYHGNQMCAQYLTNIQEHFVQKVKTFCTEMIVKRFLDQVPQGMTR